MWSVLILFAVGFGAAKVAHPPAGTVEAMDWLVLTLALPALVLRRLSEVQLDAALAIPVAVAWASLAVAALLVTAIGRLRGYERSTIGALMLVTAIANTSFFGLPAVRALVGDDAVATVLLYDQTGTFLAVATFGTIVVALFSTDGSSATPDWRRIARRIGAFPPFVALVVALALAALGSARGHVLVWPTALGDALDWAGAALVPLATWSTAFRAARLSDFRFDEAFLVGLTIRLVAVPLLVVAAMWLIAGRHPSSLPLRVSALESAMPPGVTAGVMASAAGLAPELATKLVAGGLIVAFVSVPLWAWVIGF